MKQVFTTTLFLFVVQCGWSQIEMKLKPRPHISVQDMDSITVTKGGVTVWRNPSYYRSTIIPNVDSSRFSHGVAAGSVYTLRQDNMPCLRPGTDLIYNMPVQTLSINDYMPNSYQQPRNKLLQLLPKQFQKNKK